MYDTSLREGDHAVIKYEYVTSEEITIISEVNSCHKDKENINMQGKR